jgi:hypothetical protein
MSSPTQRSLEVLRKEGYLAQSVEKWVAYPPPGHRVDLFGFADILAVRGPLKNRPWPSSAEEAQQNGPQRMLVQATSGHGNLWARREKLKENLNVAICQQAGFVVVIDGWVKKKIKRGGVAFRYQLKREVL